MEVQEMLENDSRLKLIESATRLFAQKGYAGVSIRELAEAANINSAMISYYFGGKEKLYAAVLEAQFTEVRKHLSSILHSELSPLEGIRQYAQGICAGHQHCPYLTRFMYSELTHPTNCFDSIVKKFIAKIFTILHQLIKEGINRGEIRSNLDPFYAAISLAAIINFYFIAKPMTESLLPPAEDTDNNYVTQALDIYLNGVKKDGR